MPDLLPFLPRIMHTLTQLTLFYVYVAIVGAIDTYSLAIRSLDQKVQVLQLGYVPNWVILTP